jgi:hypothetical protein
MIRSSASVIDRNNKPVLIVFSHLRWDFIYQRPQHLLTRAAENYHVFFIEEPLNEGDVFSCRELSRGEGITVIQPLLPKSATADEAVAHQTDIAEEVAARAGNAQIFLWYYTPMALDFSDAIACDLVIFDKMDELSAFAFAPPGLCAFEASLMESADLVFTGGASLHAKAVDRNPNVHCFPSSIDAAHFGRARNGLEADPADQASLSGPRLGFFGVIDERIDLAMIADVAALRPDWQLVMVGPVVKIDPATLPRAANIHWLGGKDYAQLPAYLAHWDMGWMPFALNAATRFISPTKTPEFLAAGLPLMSTPIHDVVEPYGRLKLVDIVATPAEAVASGERMLAELWDTAAVAARLAVADRHIARGSWDKTWAAMRSLIEAAARPARMVAKTSTAKEALRV